MKKEYKILLKHYKHKKSSYEELGSPYTDKGWNWIFKCKSCGIEIIGIKDEEKNIDGHFIWQGSDTDLTLSITKIKQELINCGLLNKKG